MFDQDFGTEKDQTDTAKRLGDTAKFPAKHRSMFRGRTLGGISDSRLALSLILSRPCPATPPRTSPKHAAIEPPTSLGGLQIWAIAFAFSGRTLDRDFHA